jgi:hypothetical protein
MEPLRAVDCQMKPGWLEMEPWRVCRPVVADSHHFDEEQAGAYLGFCQGGGGAHFWLSFHPSPPPDPHQNNADPQPWAQLSKDCCLIYNYVLVNKLAFFSCCPLPHLFS